MTSSRSWAIHPALVALVPALALYAQNADLAPAIELLIAGGVCVVVILGLWALLRSLAAPRHLAPVAITTGFAIFFLFGPLVGAARSLWDSQALGVALGMAAWAGLLAFALTMIGRADERQLRRANAWLDRTVGLLVSIQILTLVPGFARAPAPIGPPLERAGHPPERLPDVYHVVLDGHGGGDVLRETYGLEGSPLARNLADRGFRIVEGARANYTQTLLSLASTLNASYLDTLARRQGPGGVDRRPLIDLVQHSRVAEFFESLGYETVTFATGYTGTELRGSDDYRSPPLNLTEFQVALIALTPLRILPALVPHRPGTTTLPFTVGPHEAHRARIRYALSELGAIASRPHPTWAFVHILSPHPPFVFDSAGADRDPLVPYSMRDGSDLLEDITAREYVEGYRGQVGYLSRALARTFDAILANSGTPPILIVHGDHGPGLGLVQDDAARTDAKERLSIMSAYYLPGASVQPPDGMTPVNTYRLILDEYFGTSLGLLPDRSYVSTWPRPYDFREIPAEVTEDAGQSGTAPTPAVYAEPRGR